MSPSPPTVGSSKGEPARRGTCRTGRPYFRRRGTRRFSTDALPHEGVSRWEAHLHPSCPALLGLHGARALRIRLRFDFAAIPIVGNAFEFHETWTTPGDKIGLDARHRIEFTTLTRGRHSATRTAGIVRFDARVLDAVSGKVLDTCTSGDQTFEATS